MIDEKLIELKNSDIIWIKHSTDELIKTIYRMDISDALKRDNVFVYCYFKIMLAKDGYIITINKLHHHANEIENLLYVEIASYVYLTVGEYASQLSCLETIRKNSYGWVERAKIKCLIALGHISEAINLTNELLYVSQNNNIDFAQSVYWQLNQWKLLKTISKGLNNDYLYKLAEYSESISSRPNGIAFKVYSLFNYYTINQLNLQLKNFNANGLDIIPSLGISSDRLTKGAASLVGDETKRGIIGASLSHMKILEDIATGNDSFALVTESDSFLSRGFDINLIEEAIIDEYDFVLCANRHFKTDMKCYNFEKIIKFEFEGRASGFDGYFVKKKCAEDILNKFDQKLHNEHIDGKIIHWLSTMGYRIGVTTHPIFSQGFCSTFSTRARVELFK
ncbi:hypothetical protein [Leclercia sp. LSNIH1]|uniref:hypothetical protein n=1 Tax=Leclercia sp. LSNIH1 TaxID=1920114 RepID=UPI000CD0FB49|nr:hypothetical protein [Leclercia sp. LSNIH1]AUU83940.1 hypothetical protein C2U54_07900 [Leclercia sp. LSNIH1]POV32022.1 hypothetical protein C3388_24000 [Leclercia sp. LSNIH5]POW61134.1 hypothetical protein C3389_23660 [Leclercia sp. LSNIH2]